MYVNIAIGKYNIGNHL